MRSFRNKRNLSTSLFVLLLLAMGLVYAYLTSNLSITGYTEISANNWDIHFDNLIVSPNSVSATADAEISINNPTSISYTVKLDRPGDFYEFTVDMVNAGSIPAKVSLVSMDGITSDAENLVLFSVVYTSSNEDVLADDILNPNASKNITVRVYYNDDITADDLPDTNIPLELSLDVTFVQSDEEESNLSPFLLSLIDDNPTCMTKYEGNVTDKVGSTVLSNNVYYNKCETKRNIIFGGYCWQMIRTTESGGMKLIYNGLPENNKCESTRGSQSIIYGGDNMNPTELDSEYLYGNSFTYDLSTGKFTLVDTFTETWSDSTYENLIGKYTCTYDTGTCSYLYQIIDYYASDGAYAIQYGIDDGEYAIIGTSLFNYYRKSPAMVGYMFNKEYLTHEKQISSTTKFGSTFTYSNGTYTLSGTTQNVSSFNSSVSNTHYTCWNTEGTCSKISYVFYRSSGRGYYIELSDGESVEDAINNMFHSNDVNAKDSIIKAFVDRWYAANLTGYTSMIEDTVYCSDRSIANLAGWDSDGGSDTVSLHFRLTTSLQHDYDLVCPNATDQFAVANNKAKLTYPVGLINQTEAMAFAGMESFGLNHYIWGITPDGIAIDSPAIMYIDTGSYSGGSQNSFGYGVRPVISLKGSTTFSSGTGSEASPWIVG